MLFFKRFLYLVVFLFFTAHNSAVCVDLCMKESNFSAKSTYSKATTNYVIWSGGHDFHGVFVCSSTSGTNDTEANTTIYQYTGNEDLGKYCWCRLLSPLVTGWIFYANGATAAFSNTAACESGCKDLCFKNIEKMFNRAR